MYIAMTVVQLMCANYAQLYEGHEFVTSQLDRTLAFWQSVNLQSAFTVDGWNGSLEYSKTLAVHWHKPGQC